MNIFSYFNNENIIQLIKDIWEWQESYNHDDLQNIINELPNLCLTEYTENNTIYRGMVVNLENIEVSSLCSWTTNYELAKQFSEQENYYDAIAEQYDNVHSVVFEKTGNYFSLNRLIKDLKDWIINNSKIILSEIDSTIEDVISRFYEEDEVISNFNLQNVNIVYMKQW